jgi:tetratricopeptide (TPR) repeat protein
LNRNSVVQRRSNLRYFLFKIRILRELIDETLEDSYNRDILAVLHLLPHGEYELLRAAIKPRDIPEFRNRLNFLSDCCLITYSLDKGYKLAELVRIVLRSRRIALPTAIAERMKEYLRNQVMSDSATIGQVQSLIFMYGAFEGEIPNEFRDLLLPSILQQIVASHRTQAFRAEHTDAKRHFELAAQLSLLAMDIPMADETREQILYDGGDSLVRCGRDPMPIVEHMRAHAMASAHLVLGSYCFRKRDFSSAEAEFRAAFVSNVRRSRSARMLAKALIAQGRPRVKEALATIESLGENRINRDSLLLREKIKCLRALGREREVDEALERLEALDDIYGDYHAFRAGQFLNEGDLTAAARHVRLASERPRANKVQLTLLDCAVKIERNDLSKLDDACAFLNSLGQTDDSRQLRARAFIKSGKWRDAERELDQVVHPGYFDLLLLTKTLNMKLDDLTVQGDPVLYGEVERKLSDVETLLAASRFSLTRE